MHARTARWLRSPLPFYCFHLLVAFPIALLFGSLFEVLVGRLYSGSPVLAALAPAAACAAGLAGFFLNRIRRDMSASFVFVPPLLFFADSWYELTRGWSPSWSKQSHTEYVMDNLFGPACANTECLYILGTATVLAGVLYSTGSFLSLRLARWHGKRPQR